MSNDEIKTIFEGVTEKLTKPIPGIDLEFLLIEKGLTVGLTNKEIKKYMTGCGFVKKQVMKHGVRSLMWVKPETHENSLQKSIRFASFIRKFTEGKTEIPFPELLEAMREAGFDSDLWNKFFYVDDGIQRVYNGWVLTRKDGEKVKVYKKVKEE